jgi:hypothetical protein
MSPMRSDGRYAAMRQWTRDHYLIVWAAAAGVAPGGLYVPLMSHGYWVRGIVGWVLTAAFLAPFTNWYFSRRTRPPFM